MSNPPTNLPGEATLDDEYDQEAQQYATAFDSEMTLLLQQVASAAEMLGQFSAMLNNAAQMYAQTDYNSAFPEV